MYLLTNFGMTGCCGMGDAASDAAAAILGTQPGTPYDASGDVNAAQSAATTAGVNQQLATLSLLNAITPNPIPCGQGINPTPCPSSGISSTMMLALAAGAVVLVLAMGRRR